MRSSRAAVLAALAFSLAGQASAAEPRSQSDEDACRPDVFRLCASEIPDEDDIVACLKADLAQLSPECHAVIAPPPVRSKRPRKVPRA